MSYNFANMTPQQLLSAGSQLLQSGAITSQQDGVLAGLACACAPMPGHPLPANLGLNSTTGQNYVQMLQNIIGEDKSLGGLDAGEQNGLTNAECLLQAFNTYQTPSTTGADSEDTTGALLNQQA
jgi:hypothetical protein